MVQPDKPTGIHSFIHSFIDSISHSTNQVTAPPGAECTVINEEDDKLE